MQRSLYGLLKPVILKVPATVTASGTTDSLNLADYGSAMLMFSVGAMAFSTADKLDLGIAESDDGTTFTPATDVYLAESGTVGKALDATADQNSVHALHYTGNKKYIRGFYNETGTVSAVLGCVAILGHARSQPSV